MCEKRRPAISRRVDTCVLDEASVGDEATDLLLPLDAWRVSSWDAPEVADWRPGDQLEARMRGSVLNDVTDALTLGAEPGDGVVRRAWARRHAEELARPRMGLSPRPAESLSAGEVDWILALASCSAHRLTSWGDIEARQEGLWLSESVAPACCGGIEDYRVRSARTGARMLIDLKALREPMRAGGRRRWPKCELYAEAYLVAAASRGLDVAGVGVLDARAGELTWLPASTFAASGDVAERVCRRVFEMPAEEVSRVVSRLAA